MLPVVFADFVDGNDARVFELRSGFGFSMKPPLFSIGGQLPGQSEVDPKSWTVGDANQRTLVLGMSRLPARISSATEVVFLAALHADARCWEATTSS